MKKEDKKNNKKKKYSIPEIEIIKFEKDHIIRTSFGPDDLEGYGE